MKKILTSITALLLVLSMSVCAFATPKKMSDGNVFDADFYAATYPDVAAAVGNSADMLYLHYVNFGATEGRQPYANDAATMAQVIALSAPKNIINKSGSASAYMSLVQAYLRLPAKYRKFIEKNKISITLLDGNYQSYASNRGNVVLYNVGNYGDGTVIQNAHLIMALYHELGHEYDFIQSKGGKAGARIADIDPFPSSEISNIEKASEITETIENGYRTLTASVYDADEVFAVLSSCYFYNPSRLQSVCPYGYAYVDKYYSQFK